MLIGIDFESRSRLDISEAGSTQYASHESTEPIFLGYASISDAYYSARRVNVWTPDRPFPPELAHMAKLDHVTFVAHNTNFDRTFWRKQLTEKLGVPFPRRWLCTAVRASANGLPRNLDDACHALGLPGKDKDGQKALKQLWKPVKKTGRFIMPADAPELYEAAKGYCQVDIQRMAQLLERTKPISADDQAYFEWDQLLNERGMPVDADGVDRLIQVLEMAQDDIQLRAAHLPSLTSPKQILEFCASLGVAMPNMQAQTLTDMLKCDIPGEVREILTLRQLAGLASIKKLPAFKQRGMEEVIDGKRFYVIRDSYVMNGAHTGRHTAKGAQTQNLKRDCATEAEVSLLLSGDLEAVKILAGEPLPLLGKAIRPMVMARRGTLLIGDFSKIETCVTFWYARHEEGLKALREGRDLYCELATVIFSRHIDKDRDPKERQVGKHGILGLGFGSGANTFWDMCNNKFGVKIAMELSEKSVSAYRTVHHPVVTFWRVLENAIKAAITTGIPQQLGPLKIAADSEQLVIVLPSGRKLRYQKPSVRNGKVHFWREDPKTHQWTETTEWGGGFTNNVVQATANCLQRVATMELERRGFELIMTSHDELVAEDEPERLDEFRSTMALEGDLMPSWAVGIPVKVEAKATLRYRKG